MNEAQAVANAIAIEVVAVQFVFDVLGEWDVDYDVTGEYDTTEQIEGEYDVEYDVLGEADG